MHILPACAMGGTAREHRALSTMPKAASGPFPFSGSWVWEHCASVASDPAMAAGGANNGLWGESDSANPIARDNEAAARTLGQRVLHRDSGQSLGTGLRALGWRNSNLLRSVA